MTTGNDGPFDAVTVKAPTTTVSIPAKFVETFLAVAEFCCRTDPLDNKAVPTNRIKKIWAMVKDGSPWNQKYFQVVRNRLHRMGVISIFDRQHHVGKAWRWTVGTSFLKEVGEKISEGSRKNIGYQQNWPRPSKRSSLLIFLMSFCCGKPFCHPERSKEDCGKPRRFFAALRMTNPR